jgi:hypothetical protein
MKKIVNINGNTEEDVLIYKLEIENEDLKRQITDIINNFSGDNLMKLQKHFVSLYGSDEMAQEKANSFAVGFGKACELICKDLENKVVYAK